MFCWKRAIKLSNLSQYTCRNRIILNKYISEFFLSLLPRKISSSLYPSLNEQLNIFFHVERSNQSNYHRWNDSIFILLGCLIDKMNHGWIRGKARRFWWCHLVYTNPFDYSLQSISLLGTIECLSICESWRNIAIKKLCFNISTWIYLPQW
jgi:hypothetical protein